MQKKIFAAMTLIAAVMATDTQAYEFGKPITTSVVITKHSDIKTLRASTNKKEITLMNIILTPEEAKNIFSYTPLSHKSFTFLPPTVNLGMNNVPVLDQGRHGTCVTFAVTAAIDALLGKGDYISQLCNLELGKNLSNKGYLPDGWNGSFAPWVIDQITRFGIVNKQYQLSRTCATQSEYPINNMEKKGLPMSLGEFNRMSESVNDQFYPVYHMSFIDRFMGRFVANDEVENVLIKVKQALVKGNRLTFGTFLVLSPYCSAGACASYRETQDTWALTPELETPPFFTGGHEMVIYGYDDNAIAIDQSGKRHQGLLMLRNSWGAEVGDHGNYYMTYDYFKKFVGDVQEFVEYKH